MPRSVFGEDPEADKHRLLLSYFVTIRLGALLGGGDHERDPGIPAVGPVAVAQGMIARVPRRHEQRGGRPFARANKRYEPASRFCEV
jgi:hypothetical protein